MQQVAMRSLLLWFRCDSSNGQINKLDHLLQTFPWHLSWVWKRGRKATNRQRAVYMCHPSSQCIILSHVRTCFKQLSGAASKTYMVYFMRRPPMRQTMNYPEVSAAYKGSNRLKTFNAMPGFHRDLPKRPLNVEPSKQATATAPHPEQWQRH